MTKPLTADRAHRLKTIATLNDVRLAALTFENAYIGAVRRKDWDLATIYQERMDDMQARLLRLNSELFA